MYTFLTQLYWQVFVWIILYGDWCIAPVFDNTRMAQEDTVSSDWLSKLLVFLRNLRILGLMYFRLSRWKRRPFSCFLCCYTTCVSSWPYLVVPDFQETSQPWLPCNSSHYYGAWCIDFQKWDRLMKGCQKWLKIIVKLPLKWQQQHQTGFEKKNTS